MVAALLWSMHTIQNYASLHSAMKAVINAGSPPLHKPQNIFEFQKVFILNPPPGTLYWARARDFLRMGEYFRFVDPGGSIQSAIDAASTNQIVYVTRGVYVGDVTIQNKVIGLFGEGPQAGIPGTIIQSPNPRTTNVIRVNTPGLDFSRIDGFWIKNGVVAIDIYPNSKAYVANNIIQDNSHGVCTFYEVIMKNNMVRMNSGDGFFIPAENATQNYTVRIYNNTFVNNANAMNFRNNQYVVNGSVYNNMMTSNSAGIRASSSSHTNPIEFLNNGFFGNSNGNFVGVNSDGGDVVTDPAYSNYFFPSSQSFWDAGFPQGSVPERFEFFDRTDATDIPPLNNDNKNCMGLYGGT
jgi:hypothetical protein